MESDVLPKYKLHDLIDIPHFQKLQDRLNEIYSFPSAIIDNDGNILTATAWQDVCTQFYRKHREGEKTCIKSDQYILHHLHEANPAVSYRCPHGLVDNAIPIIIDGIHFGNFFTGQFFLEKPDIAFYREQAKKYGFDEDAFIAAVNKVPVWTADQTSSYLLFIKELIAIISNSALAHLKGMETRNKIERSEQRICALIKTTKDGYVIISEDGRIKETNEAYSHMTGYSIDELIDMPIYRIETTDPPAELESWMEHLPSQSSDQFEIKYRKKDGTIIDVEVSVTCLPSDETQFLYVCRDISTRKQSEHILLQKTALLEAQLNATPDGILVVDNNGKKIIQNRQTVKLWNIPEHIASNPDDSVQIQHVTKYTKHPELFVERIKYQYSHPKETTRGEVELIDGTILERYSAPVIGEDGHHYGRIWNFHDITAQRKMENELLASKLLLQSCIESPAGIIIMAIDCNYRYLCFNRAHNDAMKMVYNATVELGANILERITSDTDRLTAKANYDRAMKGESHSTIEVFGSERKVYYESYYNPIYNDTHEIIGITAYAIDVTARTELEESLRKSEQKYGSLFNAMLEGFALHEIICDTNNKPIDYRFIDLNPAFEKLTGINKSDTVGKTVMELMPTTEPVWIEKYGKVALTGEPINFENYASALDRHYQVIAFSPKVHQFAVIINDITERKKTEAAIAAEKERLSVTLRSIGDGVITTDTSGCVVLLNRAAEELTGWSICEAEGKPLATIFNLLHQHTREPFENSAEQVLSSGQHVECTNHTILVAQSGREYTIAHSGAPIKDTTNTVIGVVIVFRDMTENQRLLDNIQRIDKLDSLGVLAGGIAHDFNNLLAGIFGYIDMARVKSSTDMTVSKYLNKALTVFERAKDLTQQLLTFSKGGIPKRTTGHLGTLVKENADFVLSGSHVRCDYTIADDLWLSDFDENQIGQVIDNIVINAQQAMPVGGTISITVDNVTLDSKESLGRTPGNYIKIVITDTGIGIPQDIIKRIFDPFFTTKQKGNGLGLATCYSIVEKHGGAIDVTSQPGKGSSFTIYLPATHTGTVEKKVQSPSGHQGKGSVIVMDDEFFIREIVCDMLATMGYTPVEAEHGEEALRVCAKEIERGCLVRCALFDLTIPGGMGGKETIVKFKEFFPDIPVFASSGFSHDPVIARPTEFGFTDSIQKPFKLSELAELLGRHLM